MSEEPSKYVTVFPSETVNIKKLANLTSNTENYGQITLNTKPHSDPLSYIYFNKQNPYPPRIGHYREYPPPLGIFVLHNSRPVSVGGINTWIKSVEVENKRVQKKSAREDKRSR